MPGGGGRSGVKGRGPTAPNPATRPAEPGATNAGPARRGPTDLAPEDLIERLRDVLACHPAVAVAYLFGSRARGRTSPLSDIDVAVLLDRAFVGDRFALQLELAGSIAAAVGSDAVDVILLDDAPPALAYRVLRDGRVILCRDELLRVRHRLRAIDEYLDTELLRRRNRAILRRRLTEGTFGRS